jgi:hypothetical protein
MAGFLLGLTLVMLLTGTPVASVRVLPKLAGAAAMILAGLVLPLTGAAIVYATVIVILVASMVLVPEPDRAVFTS